MLWIALAVLALACVKFGKLLLTVQLLSVGMLVVSAVAAGLAAIVLFSRTQWAKRFARTTTANDG